MNILKFGLLFLVVLRISLGARRLHSGKFAEFYWQGEKFAARFERTKRKGDGLCVRLAIQDKLRFVLRRETRFDRIAKSLGIASEWQTGDTGFDQKVFILSEDVSLNRALSRDRELRDVCVSLLGSREVVAIECRAGMLYLGFGVEDIDKENPAGVGPRFSRELAALLKLRQCLQRIVASGWQEERDPALTRKAWLVGTSLVLGIAGIVALVFDLGVDRHQVVREVIPRLAAWITVGVVGLLLFATFAWLRSTPHTHAVLLDVLLAAAPGCWAVANGAATVYNEKFDRSTAQLLPVTVHYTEKKRSRGGASHYLNVKRWPDPRGGRKVRISSHEFQWMRPGSCITVIWHRGRLGDGWVSGYRRGCESEPDVER